MPGNWWRTSSGRPRRFARSAGPCASARASRPAPGAASGRRRVASCRDAERRDGHADRRREEPLMDDRKMFAPLRHREVASPEAKVFALLAAYDAGATAAALADA